MTSEKRMVMPTRNGIGLEAVDWVLMAVTGTSATAVRTDAGTWAVNCVLLTTVVGNAVLPK